MISEEECFNIAFELILEEPMERIEEDNKKMLHGILCGFLIIAIATASYTIVKGITYDARMESYYEESIED